MNESILKYNQNKINPYTPVYYINLDDNKKRNFHINDMLRNYGFVNINRISAVDTRHIKSVHFYKKMIKSDAYTTLISDILNKKRNFHRSLTKGAIGCYLSHCLIYKDIVDKNIPYAIILEDDCKFFTSVSKFWNIINTIKIPNDTDILLYDALVYDFNSNNCPINNLCQIYFFFGLHFYLVTLKGAKILLNNLLPIEYQLDSKLSILASENKIVIYKYNDSINSLAKQDKQMFKTDIQLLGCKNCNIYKEIFDLKKNIKNNDMYEYHNYNNCDNADIMLLTSIIIIIIIICFTY